MNAAQVKRCYLRGPSLSGVSVKGKPFEDDAWYMANIKPLLDAHFACSRPVRAVVLDDVERMLAERVCQDHIGL